MIEEPYRWVEAIATRRDYIEMQLATGSPVVALGYDEGILLLTVGQQKLFEIYDRIALGAIGHPGDIERLRMAAIELASTEGFTRSAADVSLRRLAYYSLSPVMKFLSKRFQSAKDLPTTLDLALDAWAVGQLKTDEAMTGDDEIRRQRSERLGNGTISAAVLERNTNRAVRYRAVEASDLAPLIAK
jgi:hypothetical protein